MKWGRQNSRTAGDTGPDKARKKDKKNKRFFGRAETIASKCVGKKAARMFSGSLKLGQNLQMRRQLKGRQRQESEGKKPYGTRYHGARTHQALIRRSWDFAQTSALSSAANL